MIDLDGYLRCLASIPLVREVEARRAARRFARQMEAIRSGDAFKGAAMEVAKLSELVGYVPPPTPRGELELSALALSQVLKVEGPHDSRCPRRVAAA